MPPLSFKTYLLWKHLLGGKYIVSVERTWKIAFKTSSGKDSRLHREYSTSRNLSLLTCDGMDFGHEFDIFQRTIHRSNQALYYESGFSKPLPIGDCQIPMVSCWFAWSMALRGESTVQALASRRLLPPRTQWHLRNLVNCHPLWEKCSYPKQ